MKMLVKAINAVGMSVILRIAMMATAPAKAPIPAAVIPSTNALMLCNPFKNVALIVPMPNLVCNLRPKSICGLQPNLCTVPN